MTTTYRNLGILAHVDAGKTTLTEQMLHQAGAIKAVGSVDKGTATTDTLAVEKERGISVRLATASFTWRDCCINLVDTPGHVDFCAEVERSLRVLDGAVLVISAVEGVQAHTSTLFHALQALKIPTLLFVNKLDRIGADVDAVMDEIRRELTPRVVLLDVAREQGEPSARPKPVWPPGPEGDDADHSLIEEITESVIENDESLLNRFLEGDTPGTDEIQESLARQTAAAALHPVLLGVAKNGLGIDRLLDAVVRYLPAAAGRRDHELSALVYRIDHHPKLGRITGVRVYDGVLTPRDPVPNTTRGITEKVAQLKKNLTGKTEDMPYLEAGDLGLVCGLSGARVGDVLGTGLGVPEAARLSAPLLTVQAVPADEGQFTHLAEALHELADEDPQLDLELLPEQHELHLKITGWIQIEVLQAVLQNRFGLRATFTAPTIIYRETPSRAGFGTERYLMPKPCWAVVKFHIEPLSRGSGVQYESRVGVNDIAQKYQNEVEQTIAGALRQGIKGWQVTDVKITLVEGEEHPIHSRPGNFKMATPMGIMNGLMETDTTLLEPLLAFRITASRDLLGSITSDLSQRRATFGSPLQVGENFVLEGRIPAATSLDYPVQLASRSGGKAKIFTRLDGYEPCSLEQGRTTPCRGISPLDRARWILQARGAMRD
jgi:ribosomal protection tetracycline resistance protein